MEKIKKRLAKLISVKTFVTLFLTVIFSILALNLHIAPESVERIFIIVISFYFGTQSEKKTKEDVSNGES